jgi:methionyl-tRNA synthetase
MTARRILVTSALPYANGQIHIGHLVEYIQTDIWVRFQRMMGNEVYYVGADDTHGTPVMLRAEKEGITPKQLIDRVWTEHKRDFDSFLVSFDNYYSTDAEENRELCEKIYLALKAEDLIAERDVEQFYDPVKNMFLPDRFIKGECPKCGAKDQYGDNCEVCGTTYVPTDLKNPYSVVSGATPVRKSSTHFFFKLSDPRCETFLREWVAIWPSPKPATRCRNGWAPKAKLDAVRLGHLARRALLRLRDPRRAGQVFLRVARRADRLLRQLQEPRGQARHRLRRLGRPALDGRAVPLHRQGHPVLPHAVLAGDAAFSGYRTPTNVFAHGFLTVDGAKMSKSRGTFITAQSYIDTGMNPEWLRYYFAAKLNASMEDLDLNLDDFVARVNSDLVGKYVNIASRAAGFMVKRFDGKVNEAALANPLLEQLRQAAPQLARTTKAASTARRCAW